MGYGGIYLRKARDGKEVTMNKIKERVRMQLETDIPADEIVVSLIKGGINLNDIQEVFISLRIPEQQAKRFALQGLEKYQQLVAAQRQQIQEQQQAQGMPRPPFTERESINCASTIEPLQSLSTK